MPGDALATLATSLLDAAVDAMSQEPPARQYVAQGEPPFDDCQLTVHLVRLQPKLLDPKLNKCIIVWVATFAIVLVRCEVPIPDGQLMPTAAALDANHQSLLVDLWDLSSGLSRAWATRTWPDSFDCSDVTWLPWEPFTPGVQGNLTGWRGSVQVAMMGPGASGS